MPRAEVHRRNLPRPQFSEQPLKLLQWGIVESTVCASCERVSLLRVSEAIPDGWVDMVVGHTQRPVAQYSVDVHGEDTEFPSVPEESTRSPCRTHGHRCNLQSHSQVPVPASRTCGTAQAHLCEKANPGETENLQTAVAPRKPTGGEVAPRVTRSRRQEGCCSSGGPAFAALHSPGGGRFGGMPRMAASR